MSRSKVDHDAKHTRHKRFAEWVQADVFGRLHQLLLDILGATGHIDWSRAAVDSLSVRAVRGGI